MVVPKRPVKGNPQDLLDPDFHDPSALSVTEECMLPVGLLLSRCSCKANLPDCLLCYTLYLGTTELTAVHGSVTEVAKRKLSVVSDLEVKDVGHLNGLAVRTLSAPNIPSTISESGKQKFAAEISRKSDSAVSLTKCGVNSSESTVTVNGHRIDHLPQSSLVCKSKILSSYEVPAASASHDMSLSRKRPDLNDRERFLKQNKTSADESYCGKMTSDTFVAKTLSGREMHVQPSNGSSRTATKCVERSAPKWNCCLNLHKKGRVKMSGSSSQIYDESSAVGSSSHYTSVSAVERKRRRDKKLSKSGCLSVSSTTKWRVKVYSDNDISTRVCNGDHATTAWHVTDVVNKSSLPRASSSDNIAAFQQSDTSATCTEAVRGGQQHMLNGADETGEVHRASVKQAVNCTYHCLCHSVFRRIC